MAFLTDILMLAAGKELCRMFMSEVEYYKNAELEMVYVYKMDHVWPTHSHPGEYQIILVLDGQLEISSSKGSLVLGADEYIVIPPQWAHAERAIVPIRVLALTVQAAALQDNATFVYWT